MRSHLVCVLLASLLFARVSHAQDGIANPGFEDGNAGDVPAGWFVPAALAAVGFKAHTVDAGCRTGGHCAVISGVENAPANMFGNLMQTFSAGGYVLHHIRLRAAVRVEGANTRAQMWLRLDRANNTMAFLENMSARPITSSEWKTYDIEADVPDDVRSIAIGTMVFGPGKAWVDDFSIDNLREIHMDKVEPPRPVTERELTNLTAFAKLYGYVRFFHPSDQAANTDWEDFAIEGVRKVADADSAAALIARLQQIFQPIAPTVRIGGSVAEAGNPAGGTEIVRNVHFGVGLPSAGPGIYKSDRKRTPATGQEMPKSFEADVTPGIHVSIPVALYADSEGTLPHAPLPGPTGVAGRSATDRATRIADVVIAWNVFQHFYPYFDVVKTDWAGELPKEMRSAATDSGPEEFHKTLRRLVAALKDGHGNVYSVSGGPVLQPPLTMDWIEGKFTVTRVQKGKSEGVAPGDQVLKIDGTTVEQLVADTRPLISGATEQWINVRLATELSTCKFTTKRMSLEIKPFANPGTNKTIDLPCFPPAAKSEGYTEPRPETIAELEPGIIYVDLDRLTEPEWVAAIPRLQQAKGIIFDMRGYPGQPGIQALAHLTDTVIRSAKWNVSSAELPDQLSSPFKESGWDVQPEAPYFSAKRVFLTDGRAISYAETVMGIVEHFKLGEIVGGPTAGTNGNVNPFRLPGGYTVAWTGMKVLKHDGSQHHGIGILPTVPVSRTRQGVADGKDELLLRGLAVVKAESK